MERVHLAAHSRFRHRCLGVEVMVQKGRGSSGSASSGLAYGERLRQRGIRRATGNGFALETGLIRVTAVNDTWKPLVGSEARTTSGIPEPHQHPVEHMFA